MDWRFLLPGSRLPFDHVVLWRERPGVADRLLETRTACVISDGRGLNASADAVIAFDGSIADVSRAADLLRPGGVLYLEMSRRLVHRLVPGLNRLRSAVRRAGFVDVAMYAAHPDRVRPAAYVPLDAPMAWLWYRRTLHQPRTFRSWMLTAGTQVAARFGIDMGSRLAAGIALTAVKGNGAQGMSLPSVLAHPSMSPLVGRHPIQPLVISGQRTVMFPFERNGGYPVAAIKIPKTAAQSEATTNEHQVLMEVRRRIGDPADVPEPLMLLHWEGVDVLAERIVEGTSIERAAGSWRCRQSTRLAHLRAAAAWLTEFHCRTQLEQSTWGAPQTNSHFVDPLDRYRETFDVSEEEDRFFDQARQHSASLIGVPVPVVWQHRDFRPVNVLQHDGTIRIIDWEGCQAGLPLCDLLHFVVEWQAAARGHHTRAERTRGFVETFLKPVDDPAGRAMAGALLDYSRALRLEPRLVPVLIVCTWAELAVRHARLVQAIGGSAAEEDNESLGFVRALAASGQLFNRAPAGSLLYVLMRDGHAR